ncbi:hypothetical protein KKC97_13675 [bacterium]|nr:hypothetical protein [bacterium]
MLFAFCLCVNTFAQETTAGNRLFSEAQTAYDNGRYNEAELAALRGVREVEADPLATIPFHVLLGFVYVARDQTEDAYREFAKVVSINPAYELDPVMTSPKILEVFRRAKKDYMDNWLSQPQIYRMPQADVRLAASARSLVLPGWGQYYKDQKIKGTAFTAFQVLSIAALAVLQAEVNRRHDDYLSIREHNSPFIEDRYQEYRRAYRMRNAAGYFALGVYILNYLDALYTPVGKKK